MDLGLRDRVAIVMGGSRGIGKAVARELALEGVDVALCSRTVGPLEDSAKELESETGRRVLPVGTDSDSLESVESMVSKTVSVFGRVDILVNSAATPGGLVQGSLAESSDDAMLADYNTKVVGAFRCAQAVAPHMRSQTWGRIINIGGLSGRGSRNIGGLRNAAMVHLTKSLSDHLGPDGITVNLVHPGTTRTERTGPMNAERARRQGVTVEEYERNIAANVAIRRMVESREVGYVVTFLASDKAAAVTGEVIAAGGGVGGAVFQ